MAEKDVWEPRETLFDHIANRLWIAERETEALETELKTLRAKAELAAQFQDYLHMQETRSDFRLSVWERAWLRKADLLTQPAGEGG
jgi:hypothetical protein